MTILNVRHSTIYRYQRPVEIGEHVLMLRPRDSHDLRLLSAVLTCSPPAALLWSHDVFGNSVAHATFAGAAEFLEITSLLTLQQYAPEWPVFMIESYAHTYPFRYSDSESVDLGALTAPQYHDPDKKLLDWATGFLQSGATDTLQLLTQINADIGKWVFYQSREDEGTQGPLDTLARGWGSCRDYAVLFVEAARHLGFGARLVSGYLYDEKAALTGSAGAGSTHAWAEVYLPGAGWIAFDPTNKLVGGANLIRVAVARNIQQVAPVQGSYVGAPSDYLGMEVSVSVTPAQS